MARNMASLALVALVCTVVLFSGSAEAARLRPATLTPATRPETHPSARHAYPRLSLVQEAARQRARHNGGSNTMFASSTYAYNTSWFEQTVDHFNFEDSRTYQQRFIWNDQYYQPGGPIFFYTGNEGDVTMFTENTGIMFEKAPKYNALIVFAEHRYYGKSMPFGNQSFTGANIGFLTSEQALADYAVLIPKIKANFTGADKSKVIAFGGSYGGMLSGWFRLKYPNIVDGALAASAPINQFPGYVSPYIFNEYVTRDFAQVTATCANVIGTSLKQIYNDGQSSTGLQPILQAFNTCPTPPGKTPPTVSDVLAYINNAITYMAMTDYPYPTSFLQPMPAWPVQAFCQALGDTPGVAGMVAATQVYYNYTGQEQCAQMLADDTSPGLGIAAWNYQACTEMVLPTASNGKTDFFWPPALWNLSAYEQSCVQSFNVTPRPNWVETHYGGVNVSAGSNIVWSNGELDPWQGGGMLTSPSPTQPAILIPKAAHHLDLRSSNPADPPEVTAAREKEWGYLEQFMGLSSPSPAPPVDHERVRSVTRK